MKSNSRRRGWYHRTSAWLKTPTNSPHPHSTLSLCMHVCVSLSKGFNADTHNTHTHIHTIGIIHYINTPKFIELKAHAHTHTRNTHQCTHTCRLSLALSLTHAHTQTDRQRHTNRQSHFLCQAHKHRQGIPSWAILVVVIIPKRKIP